MAGEKEQDATTLLNSASKGDRLAAEALAALVYDSLRRRAAAYLKRERPDHTLQPTALVHEAYLRLFNQSKLGFQDRTHFLAVATQTMRRILIEHARGKGREKRGGNRQRVSLDGLSIGLNNKSAPVEDLADALEDLAAEDERACKIVEMFHLGGMTQQEVAEVLGLSDRTVRTNLRFARAWLLQRLGSELDAKP